MTDDTMAEYVALVDAYSLFIARMLDAVEGWVIHPDHVAALGTYRRMAESMNMLHILYADDLKRLSPN